MKKRALELIMETSTCENDHSTPPLKMNGLIFGITKILLLSPKTKTNWPKMPKKKSRENGKQSRSIFFFISLTSLSRLFLSYREEPIGRWVETGVPQENHLTHLQAEHVLSHLWPVRGLNLHQAQR